LVVLWDRGKGEGMPFGANNPFDKARRPGRELSVVAKLDVSTGVTIASHEPPGVTTPGRMAGIVVRAADASGPGRHR
jgi:hypothetical protein